VKKAEPYHKQLILDILSKSFDDNKSVNYVVKQDNYREDRIRGLIDYSFNVCYAFGEVWISDDEKACALILLPDKKKTTLSAVLWDAKLAISVIGLNRVGPVLSRESKIKSFHPKDKFSYLWFIGVSNLFQNRGKGSQLLEGIIQNSEANEKPIYLETSVERNIPWYKKHGFEVFQTLDFGYTLYMLRRSS
jgi:ribosomal protein S18 acetylase RimI-like enzyme